MTGRPALVPAPAPASPAGLAWGMTTSALTLPTVRLLVHSAVAGAGLAAVLTSAGFGVQAAATATDESWADVWLIDDASLADPEALAEAPALVSVGSVAWVSLLSELSAGGYAALPTDATPAELFAGVLGAAAGLAVLPPAQVGLTEPDEEEDFPEGDVALTPRERDVLGLLAEGLSNKRAARELGVSESTVKFHVQAIYSKLGVQSRTAAVTRGLQLGLVSI